MRKDIEFLYRAAFDDYRTRQYLIETEIPKLRAEADDLGRIACQCAERGLADVWHDGGMIDLENEIRAAISHAEQQMGSQ